MDYYEAREPSEALLPDLDYSEPPAGSDRRSFMMRSAMATAVVVAHDRAHADHL